MIALLYVVFFSLSGLLIYIGYKSVSKSLTRVENIPYTYALSKGGVFGIKHFILITLALTITPILILTLKGNLSRGSNNNVRDNSGINDSLTSSLSQSQIGRKKFIEKEIDSLRNELDKVEDFGSKDTPNHKTVFASTLPRVIKEKRSITGDNQVLKTYNYGNVSNTTDLFFNVHISPFDDSLSRTYKSLSRLIEGHNNIILSFECRDTLIKGLRKFTILYNPNVKEVQQYASIISEINSKSFIRSSEGLSKLLENRMQTAEMTKKDYNGNILNNKKLQCLYSKSFNLQCKNNLFVADILKHVGIYYVSISVGEIEYYRKAFNIVGY